MLQIFLSRVFWIYKAIYIYENWLDKIDQRYE